MNAIFAIDESLGLGFRDSLPWPFIKEDMRHFVQTTKNQTVAMGRGTWQSSMPTPLPNRRNIVVTSSAAPDVETVSNVSSLPADCFIIGGAKLIESSWSEITTVYLTLIHGSFVSDCKINQTIIDDLYSSNWTGTHISTTSKCSIYVYRRND
jgi:dihydrofolate reductase